MPAENLSPTASCQRSNAEDAELAQVLDAYLADLEAGRAVDPNQVVAGHPAIAERLRACLIGLHQVEHGNEVLGSPGDAAKPRPRDARLGDYRLIREVGRGGMGVVYEAEQISLGRRVALKVLPFAAALDPKQLQRFKTEAQAAAQLHHTNIVPVHAVGCERGVHYYAMQFIEGQTLAAFIQQLRRQTGREEDVTAPDAAPPDPAGERGTPAAGRPVAGEPMVQDEESPEPTKPHPAPGQEASQPAPPPTDPTPRAGAETPTLPATQGPARYRTLARLGLQAAEALEHAHQVGVIHRDVKPANLMVDLRGRLWVADFGLARFHGAAGLTLTGDVVGTVRYASPEQLQGRPGAVDHRTDVYSLGVTLYELLALEPAFDGQCRQELLHQIAAAEPIPPRRRDRAFPAELEVIVLKAMEKSPDDRYGTAQELADDLQRFLEDAPIRARRPTLPQRLRRWGRRHRPTVWSAAVFALLTLAVVAASLGWIARDRADREAAAAHDKAAREAALDQEVGRTLDVAAEHLENGKWPEAGAPVEQADTLLAAAGRAERPARLQELRRDVAMAQRLEEIYSQPQGKGLDPGREQDAAYDEAFRRYGIDLAVLLPPEAAERIRTRTIRLELALALDFWSMNRVRLVDQGGPDGKQLRAIAKAADPDPWRNRLRAALDASGDNYPALVALAASADVPQWPVQTLALLGRALANRPSPMVAITLPLRVGPKPDEGPAPAEVFLRKAQRQHPDDVWLNVALADYFLNRTGQYDEAVRFYTAARTLRTRNPYISYGLGLARYRQGSLQEAHAELSKAIELNPDYPEAWIARGTVSMKLRQPDGVIADFSRVIELQPKTTLRQPIAFIPGRLDLSPSWEQVHFYRGSAYARLGQWDKAVADLSEALDGAATHKEARFQRAYAYTVLGKWDKAAADLTPANFELAPLDDVWFQVACLRLLQVDNDGYRQLGRQLQERIGRTKGGFTGKQAFLASRVCMLRPETNPDPAQGVLWAEKALADQPNIPWYLHTLALAHYRAGQFEEAAARSQEALKADPHWSGVMLNWLVLALAHQRLGHADESRQWLKKATSWREKGTQGSAKGEPPSPPDLHLNDWLEFEVLYPEATQLLK